MCIAHGFLQAYLCTQTSNCNGSVLFHLFRNSPMLPKMLIHSHSSDFDNIALYNSLSMILMSPTPLKADELCLSGDLDLIRHMKGAKGVKNVLRLLSLYELGACVEEEENQGMYFCRYAIDSQNNQKVYSLKQFKKGTRSIDSKPITLPLDAPTRAILVRGMYVFALERSFLTLYRIDARGVHLKQYKPSLLGLNFSCLEMVALQYCGRDYVLVFGNTQLNQNWRLACTVYEVKKNEFRFVKSATLWEKQVGFQLHSPAIFFDGQFCFIVGGFTDSKHLNDVYSGLQVSLHLLLTDCLAYPTQLTNVAPFTSRLRPVSGGKVIKIEGSILVVSNQTETICELQLRYEDKDVLKQIEVKKGGLVMREKVLTTEDNMQLEGGRLYWCDPNMNCSSGLDLKKYLHACKK